MFIFLGNFNLSMETLLENTKINIPNKLNENNLTCKGGVKETCDGSGTFFISLLHHFFLSTRLYPLSYYFIILIEKRELP